MRIARYTPPEPTQFVRMIPYCVDYTAKKGVWNFGSDHIYIFATLARDTILWKQCHVMVEKTKKTYRLKKWCNKNNRCVNAGWHKEKCQVYQDVIVKLLCKAGTKIGFHVQGEKMRVNKVDKVLSIENLKGNKSFKTANSHHNPRFIYRVGKSKKPGKFSKRQETCAGGIHCYLTRREAERHV